MNGRHVSLTAQGARVLLSFDMLHISGSSVLHSGPYKELSLVLSHPQTQRERGADIQSQLDVIH